MDGRWEASSGDGVSIVTALVDKDEMTGGAVCPRALDLAKEEPVASADVGSAYSEQAERLILAENWPKLRQIAGAYRVLVCMVFGQWILQWILGAALDAWQAPAAAKVVLLACTLLMCASAALRLTVLLRLQAPGLWVLGMFIPLANLIVLAALSTRAAKLFRDRGIHVGLFGPSAHSLRIAEATAQREPSFPAPDWQEVRQVASVYRALTCLVLLILICLWIFKPARAAWQAPAALEVVLAASVVLACATCAFRLAALLRLRTPGLWALGMLIPLVHLIVLAMLSTRANRYFRDRGIHVGVFGPSARSLKRAEATTGRSPLPRAMAS